MFLFYSDEFLRIMKGTSANRTDGKLEIRSIMFRLFRRIQQRIITMRRLIFE